MVIPSLTGGSGRKKTSLRPPPPKKQIWKKNPYGWCAVAQTYVRPTQGRAVTHKHTNKHTNKQTNIPNRPCPLRAKKRVALWNACVCVLVYIYDIYIYTYTHTFGVCVVKEHKFLLVLIIAYQRIRSTSVTGGKLSYLS